MRCRAANGIAMGQGVFVCCSAEDGAIGDAVCAGLEAAGFSCWIASRDVVAGTPPAVQVVGAVDASGLVVFVFSANANDDPDVYRELELANMRRKQIVWFDVDDVSPRDKFWYFIGRAQAVPANARPLDARIAELVELVRRLQNPPPRVTELPAQIDAYLCYSQHDRDMAGNLRRILNARGIRCWAVHRDFVKGIAYGAQVVTAMSRARIQVLLVSAKSIASENVRFEMAVASEQSKPVLCVRLEDVPVTGELSFYVSGAASVDAWGDGRRFDAAVAAAGDLLAHAQPESAGASVREPAAQQPDVFVSYSSKNAEVANAAVASLETAGVDCYIAPRDQRPGFGWQGQLVRAIRNSKVVVLIFSSAAGASDEVARELALAAQGRKPIIPFKIQEFTVSDDIAYYTINLQYVDATSPPIEDRLGELVGSVRDAVESL